MSDPLLLVRGLVKRYGDRTVVDCLDLECRAGMVLGLLGPNGAGKTTTLRMLYGFVRPDAGQILYNGKRFDTFRDELKGLIGVCTQEDSVDQDFTVEQNLRIYATYFRPRPQDLDRRIGELLDLFGLRPFAGHRPQTLSGGFKRRLMIARSLVHDPKILFLDEPTTGLDPAARIEVWTLVSELRQRGLGVILTTHYMDEAERLSDEVLVLSRGKTVAQGQPRQLLGDILGEHVAIVKHAGIDRPTFESWVLQHVGSPATVVLDEWQVAMTSAQLAAMTSAFPGLRFVSRQPTLDDLFLRLSVQQGA
jgi:lipooligosaccharide transport system ATP-binding protein